MVTLMAEHSTVTYSLPFDQSEFLECSSPLSVGCEETSRPMNLREGRACLGFWFHWVESPSPSRPGACRWAGVLAGTAESSHRKPELEAEGMYWEWQVTFKAHPQ